MLVEKLMRLFVVIVLIALYGLATSSTSFAAEASSPGKAVVSFVQAVQNKNIDRAFQLDFYQQRETEGKFKDEISNMKNNYAKAFEGNPSRCPSTNGIVPCDTIGNLSIVTDVRLLVPSTSKYDVTEVVYSDQQKKTARLLLKSSYSQENHPVYVNNLEAVQIYKGGITPVPPIFSGYGILTSNNAMLSVTECGRGYRFPFKFVRKEIQNATLEFVTTNVNGSWLIQDLRIDEKRLSFY